MVPEFASVERPLTDLARRGRSAGPRFAGMLLLLLVFGFGCVPGPSGEDLVRSQREFQLAAAMHQEQNIPGAIQHLRQSLELDSENPEAHLLMSLIQYHRHDLELAEQHARQGRDLLVEQQREGATLAEARNVLGVILTERGQYPEAIENFEASARDAMNTQPHLAWGNLGWAYLEQGQPQAAIEPLLTAVRHQPLFCTGFHRLGTAYFELEQFEAAEEALVHALEADASCGEDGVHQGAWRLRGEVRARLGHRDDAIHDLERCVALGPRSADGQACQRLLDAASDAPALSPTSEAVN